MIRTILGSHLSKVSNGILSTKHDYKNDRDYYNWSILSIMLDYKLLLLYY